jgi:hypothetical protein
MEALRLAASFYHDQTNKRTEISTGVLFVCCSFARWPRYSPRCDSDGAFALASIAGGGVQNFASLRRAWVFAISCENLIGNTHRPNAR